MFQRIEDAAEPVLAVVSEPSFATAVARRAEIAEELAAQYMGNLASEARHALGLFRRIPASWQSPMIALFERP